jgi:hypothetical protein
MNWLHCAFIHFVVSACSCLNLSLFQRWVNPTGGLWWHARAWRSRSHWNATTKQIEEWQLAHSPPGVRLVIVGASAGWMLSQAWLTRFQEIHTWDIDPWSERLFGWRHGKALRRAGISWVHHNHDAWLDPQAWEMSGPDTLYWFDNVLGQLPLVMLISEVHTRINGLQEALRRSHWGSVHDRYSGPIQGGRALPVPWTSNSGTLIDDGRAQTWLHQWGGHGEWSDHLTADVFRPGTPVLNVAWAFNHEIGHWLEMGWQSPRI